MKASAEQQQIIEAPDRHYLVVASAGSGKTRVLTERVRHLIEIKKVRSRILSLTFTNKAAEEMRQRLQMLPDLQERAYIGTIHSFCQTVIESHGRVVGYESMPAILEREADRISMLEAAFHQSPELRRHLMRHEDPSKRRKFLYDVLSMISACKRDWDKFQKISSGDWANDQEARAFREYQDHLASQGVIDFDDILLLALRVLTDRPAVASIYQRTYQYLCVDEAQDLNAVQYALIRTLGIESKSVLMVGDPNQAIYGFNGSSHRFMLEDFPKDFGAELIELRQNYRSSKAVILAANALYPESNEADKAALEGEAKIIACADEEAEAEWVVNRVLTLLDEGEHPEIEGAITPDRMVVLARNRFVFAPLQKRLEEAGVAFHLRQPSSGAALDSEAGKVLDLAIRLIINPRNRLISDQLSRTLGAEADEAVFGKEGRAMLEDIFQAADDTWKPWLTPVAEFVGGLDEDVNRFRTLLQALESAWTDTAANLESSKEAGEQALADVKYLREIWDNYIRNASQEARSLAQFRNQMATGEILPHLTGKGLMLAPVHTVKGLEFETVFLIGMVEGTFPDYRAVKTGGSALAEEKNDAFVGVTRAKRLLYLTWPESKFMPWDRETRARQHKSRFLKMIEKRTSA